MLLARVTEQKTLLRLCRTLNNSPTVVRLPCLRERRRRAMNVKSMVSFQQNSPYNVEKAKLKSSSNGGNYLFELKKNSFCVKQEGQRSKTCVNLPLSSALETGKLSGTLSLFPYALVSSLQSTDQVLIGTRTHGDSTRFVVVFEDSSADRNVEEGAPMHAFVSAASNEDAKSILEAVRQLVFQNITCKSPKTQESESEKQVFHAYKMLKLADRERTVHNLWGTLLHVKQLFAHDELSAFSSQAEKKIVESFKNDASYDGVDVYVLPRTTNVEIVSQTGCEESEVSTKSLSQFLIFLQKKDASKKYYARMPHAYADIFPDLSACEWKHGSSTQKASIATSIDLSTWMKQIVAFTLSCVENNPSRSDMSIRVVDGVHESLSNRSKTESRSIQKDRKKSASSDSKRNTENRIVDDEAEGDDESEENESEDGEEEDEMDEEMKKFLVSEDEEEDDDEAQEGSDEDDEKSDMDVESLQAEKLEPTACEIVDRRNARYEAKRSLDTIEDAKLKGRQERSAKRSRSAKSSRVVESDEEEDASENKSFTNQELIDEFNSVVKQAALLQSEITSRGVSVEHRDEFFNGLQKIVGCITTTGDQRAKEREAERKAIGMVAGSNENAEKAWNVFNSLNTTLQQKWFTLLHDILSEKGVAGVNEVISDAIHLSSEAEK